MNTRWGSVLLLLMGFSSLVESWKFRIDANDTFIINLDSGCLSTADYSDDPDVAKDEGIEDSDDETYGRRLLRLGDVRSRWGNKKRKLYGVFGNPVVLSPQPDCPIFQTIDTGVTDEYLLTIDGGTSCIGLTQYANPAAYQMRGGKRAGDLTELVPLQLVSCQNLGCDKIPNLGCPIPFKFNDCDSRALGCQNISLKGDMPYSNGGRLRTQEWATSLMVQPKLVLNPYEARRPIFQVQPNNTQVFVGHNSMAPTVFNYHPSKNREENREDYWKFRTSLYKARLFDNLAYVAFQTWSLQCITCRELLDNSVAGLLTSAKWELIPGGTNSMGATNTIQVTKGLTIEGSETKGTSHTTEHSVAIALSNSFSFGYDGAHFMFSSTFSNTVTNSDSDSDTTSSSKSDAYTRSSSSTFDQSCPSSSEDYLKDNPGYMKGVAMWQWVTRGEYHVEDTSPTPWATYFSNHVLCTYGSEPSTYGPEPKCPPTWCEGGPAHNCQTCSSYAWRNISYTQRPFHTKDHTQTTNPYLTNDPDHNRRASAEVVEPSVQDAPDHDVSSPSHTGLIVVGVIGVVIGVVLGVVLGRLN